MKVYDYKCEDCELVQERFVKDVNQEVVCKNCKSNCKRLVNAAGGFQFKGSGFYETDYKHK